MSSPSQLCTLRLPRASLPVVPGSPLSFDVVVANHSTVVERFEISAIGLDPAWVTFSASSVALMPGKDQTISVVLTIPRGPLVPAGPRPFGLMARSSSDPSRSVVVEAELDIAPFDAVAASLRPKVGRARRRRSFRLTMRNIGNRRIDWALSADSPNDDLDVRLSASLALDAGAERVVRVRVRALGPKTPHERRPFTVEIRDARREPVKHVKGELHLSPTFSHLMKVVAVGVLATLLVVFLMFSRKGPQSRANVDLGTEQPAGPSTSGGPTSGPPTSVTDNGSTTTSEPTTAAPTTTTTTTTVANGGTTTTTAPPNGATTTTPHNTTPTTTTTTAPPTTTTTTTVPVRPPKITGVSPAVIPPDPNPQRVTVTGDDFKVNPPTSFSLTIPGLSISAITIADSQHASFVVTSGDKAAGQSGPLVATTSAGSSAAWSISVANPYSLSSATLVQQANATAATVTVPGVGLQGAVVVASVNVPNGQATIATTKTDANGLSVTVNLPASPRPVDHTYYHLTTSTSVVYLPLQLRLAGSVPTNGVTTPIVLNVPIQTLSWSYVANPTQTIDYDVKYYVASASITATCEYIHSSSETAAWTIRANPGWSIDTRVGDPGHPGVSDIANRSWDQANGTQTGYTYGATSSTEVRITARICAADFWGAGAQFEHIYRVYLVAN